MNYKEKMEKEFNSAKLSREGKAVSKAVISALTEFAQQNKEFAQAIEQGGKVNDCIESTVKGVGNSIPDIEVYRKAVQFYFPGAKVNFAMTIDLGDEGFSNAETVAEDKPEKQTSLNISLDSLLDFLD